jgi:hypothetical protein
LMSPAMKLEHAPVQRTAVLLNPCFRSFRDTFAYSVTPQERKSATQRTAGKAVHQKVQQLARTQHCTNAAKKLGI